MGQKKLKKREEKYYSQVKWILYNLAGCNCHVKVSYLS